MEALERISLQPSSSLLLPSFRLFSCRSSSPSLSNSLPPSLPPSSPPRVEWSFLLANFFPGSRPRDMPPAAKRRTANGKHKSRPVLIYLECMRGGPKKRAKHASNKWRGTLQNLSERHDTLWNYGIKGMRITIHTSEPSGARGPERAKEMAIRVSPGHIQVVEMVGGM